MKTDSWSRSDIVSGNKGSKSAKSENPIFPYNASSIFKYSILIAYKILNLKTVFNCSSGFIMPIFYTYITIASNPLRIKNISYN